MAANQDSNAQHLMYPQHSYAGYQSTNTTANTIGAWNQSPQNQTPYAIPYHGDMASYTEKASYGGAYPPLQYNTRDTGDYYNPYGAQFAQQPHQQAGQWSQQSAYQQQAFVGQQPVYNSYGGVGVASLSMLENPAQTAAAYTASWVSSTSSIPPELRDEPERDDLVAGASAVFTPPVNSFADQFGNLSLHDNKVYANFNVFIFIFSIILLTLYDIILCVKIVLPENKLKGQDGIVGQWENKSTLAAQQWPGLGQEGNEQTGTIGQSKGKKRVGDDRERRSREEPRELTWDERLRKAAVQKERVEQRGTERGDRDSRDIPAGGDRGLRNRVGQRGLVRGGTRNDRFQREKDGIQRDWKNEGCDRNQNLHNGSGDGPNGIRGAGGYRGSNRGGSRGGMGHNVSQLLPTHGPFPPGKFDD
uniref:Uncharacterized protein n=1 Tax=Heterorhabditis bacteriophora TaxID=37862 RepID=A0A1I7XHF9_HETBA